MRKGKNRQDMLTEDLISYHPKQWRINIPFRDYTIRFEDIIPAFSGVIGKISLIAAFAVAWSVGLNLADPTFVTENVRLEIVLASVLTLLFCAILNPFAGPPGTLAPLIPIIPAMIASGVHPFPLSILISITGLVISAYRYFSKLVEINGPGTKSGIILLFGLLGVTSSVGNLKEWAEKIKEPGMFVILIIVGLILYILSGKLKTKWLIIPACAVLAIVVASLYNIYPVSNTGINLPILNPNKWWNEKWGLGWGLTVNNFIKALPFAILGVVMWPIDALAVKSIQEESYPKEARKDVFDMNATYMIVSLRNLLGGVLGGAQISAVWRSFMIPLGVVKRPIGGSALLLGIFGVSFGILGFPIDVAVFPPLLWMVLIFGIYIPLIEVGLSSIKRAPTAQIAAICIIAGIAVNPVLGWSASIVVENFNIIKDPENERVLSARDRYFSAGLAVVSLGTYLMTIF